MISEVFPPESVFRIDHYLGKETVQNILAMRFANAMFEPIWNSNYVDHVQITMAEDIGIGGRAGYYDGIGAARDVIQNHLLQLMALIAMEEPTSFDAQSLRIEKQKVLSVGRAARDGSTCTPRAAQYAEGWAGGDEGARLPARSRTSPRTRTTETYAAIKLDIETRRWAGVPFYLRHGKRLGRRVTEVAVVFKRAPHLPFTETATEELTQNALVIRVQPDEGITMRFGSKVPGTAMEIRDVNMDFAYGGSFTESVAGGLRAADPRRAARRPAAVPAARGGRAVLEDPRPDRELLGRRTGSPTPTSPAPGGRRRPTRCWPATAAPGGGRDRPDSAEDPHDRADDTNASAIAAEFVRARRRAGSPAMGMVMTLVDRRRRGPTPTQAMAAARSASREHPARDPRRGPGRRPRQPPGWTPRSASAPARPASAP